ncbi:hypothetical protein BDQ12DRAFT_684762, partial [Crucibulum laeve]
MSRLPLPALLLSGYLNSPPRIPLLGIVKSANHAYGAALAGHSTGTDGGCRGGEESIAVFVRGTSGIGRSIAESFARHANGRGRVLLVEQNEHAAHAILSSTPSSSNTKSQFIPCDLANSTSLSLCIDALSTLPKINCLILTPGCFSLYPHSDANPSSKDRQVDSKLMVHYYARWKLIHDLASLLEGATALGEDGKVLTVSRPGWGGRANLYDLGLNRTYGAIAASLQMPTYNDFMIESFALLHPSLTFINAYPGFVRTPLLSSSPTLRELSSYPFPVPALAASLVALAEVMTYPLSRSAEECAEWMWRGVWSSSRASNGKYGENVKGYFPSYMAEKIVDVSGKVKEKHGAFRLGAYGEDLGAQRSFGTEDARRMVWEHTGRIMGA